MTTPLPLVLGTAQLGMPYGIANSRGFMSESESHLFLEAAWALNYRSIDTAQGYGESEYRIGRFQELRPHQRFDVVTKISPTADLISASDIEASVSRSAARLGRPLFGLLLHYGEMLNDWNGPLGATLERLWESGEVKSIGASVYSSEELDRALAIASLRLIQVPFHVFDQDPNALRSIQSALAEGRRIYVRSVFLQGLLVMDPKAAISRVPGVEFYLSRWWKIVADSGRSAASVAFHFVRGCIPDAELIVGCESVEQLEENARLAREPALEPRIMEQLRDFPVVPEAIKSPRFWPKG